MSDSVDALLAPCDPAVRETALALRALLHDTVPDAREKVYPGWNSIGYSFDGTLTTSFCGIVAHSAHVNLQFSDGVSLNNPSELLEGTGKRARHVKLRSASEVHTDALQALVTQAASLVRPEHEAG